MPFFEKKLNPVIGLIPDEMTLDQVRVAILQLMAQESVNRHRMGLLYNYTVDTKLAEKKGFENAGDFFTKSIPDLSLSSLQLYGKVAAVFSEEICGRFGITCLSLGITYSEVADVKLSHEQPGGTVIEVPDANGQVVSKPFSACSVDELRKAIMRKRKPTSSKPLPPEDVALSDQYRDAVAARFTKGDAVRVQVRNNRGRAVVDFKNIPLDQVARLTEALASLGGLTLAVSPEPAPAEKAQPDA